ncbi:MAG: DNA-3-methyladenine glycosylase 2 [Oscillospiraceae bacterium]|nr:DNA-3-methyladenine glycosylase 2 [Oscillospiraceae bacterium]
MKILTNVNELDPARTFLCGQCFRWQEDESGGFSGIARGRRIFVSQNGDKVEIDGIPDADEKLWRSYFDLDADYGEYIARLSEDKTLKKACEASAGIRILRQEPFETLLSFIISQNNNIPRISGIIARFSEQFGGKIGDNDYAFPTAEKLRGIEAGDLAPLRAGFRARYIADAVDKINRGEINFEEIDALPLEPARERLKTIVGVGDKVADCVLLFAFHKTDAFPKDVWIKRIMSECFPDGLPECTKGIEGIAQQFLFDYFRNVRSEKEISALKS